jgi:glyoxylase-like metal-dependent hydrolase (beta-lactamase superfamily II)
MHSKWDMFVHVKELGVLCTGDAVVEYETAYFHTADIRSWILSLEKLADMKGRWVLAGHGASLFPYSYIRDFAAHLKGVEKSAKICLSRYNANPRLTDKERFADAGTAKVGKLVDAYFAEGGPDAGFLEKNAGKEDARREVRMVLWSMIREFLR